MNWRSYFWPVTLWRAAGPSGVIHVIESMGQRILEVDGYPQSGPRYLRVWKRVLSQINSLAGLGKCLVLGLGGGSAIKVLSHRYPDLMLAVVELDPRVIQMARQFFGVLPSPQLTIRQADAAQVVKKDPGKYELVIVDLYSGNDVPPFVRQVDFLEQINRLLSPDGQVVFNYASQGLRERDFVRFEQLLGRHFAQVKRLRIRDHQYMFAGVRRSSDA